MQLKLTVVRGGETPEADVLVTADTTATVGAIAAAIAERDPTRVGEPAEPTLWIADEGGRILDPDAPIGEAGVLSGQHISVAERSAWRSADHGPPAATLKVITGPDKGEDFPLRRGSSQLGRSRQDSDVALTDPQVSKTHLRINVGEVVEIIDLGSSNGTAIGGELIDRAVVRSRDLVVVGDTTFQVVHHDGEGQTPTSVLFNRSPRIDVVYEGVEHPAPEPPEPFRKQRLPIVPVIAPVVFGCIMFAVTRQLITIMFVALSPFMLLGNVLEQRIFGRREHEKHVAAFREALARLDAELTSQAGIEAETRRLEHPRTEVLIGGAMRREPLLWSYRPDGRGFLDVRLGLGAMPSRNSVNLDNTRNGIPDLVYELRAIVFKHRDVDAVPVVASLPECGSVGFSGRREVALPCLRAAVAQIAALHSPSEVILGAIVPSERITDWAWLKWFPHSASDHSPIGRSAVHLAGSPGAISQLVDHLDEMVTERLTTGTESRTTVPSMVIVVENDAPISRARLVDLAERGRHVGVHLLWLAPSVAALPAACRVFLDVDNSDPTRGDVGFVDGFPGRAGGMVVTPVAVEAASSDDLAAMARVQAPVVDAGARIDDASDLPRTVAMPALVGMDVLGDPDAVIDRWRLSNSLPSAFTRRTKPNHLRSVVGSAATGAMVLDMREHGPHALVGGTTGSGKSEFLQSWVLGIALEHSPARATFLFVDYKGGSAFAECVKLPHCVGLVTDLSPQLVRRALTSLNAELAHREKLLNKKGKKDLIELEKDGDVEAPPSLFIVVDEFAALAQEVPEFVDGVINVAQRGRSLGLHLILATQRPANVITGNLRANTNLRVALRVADESDSDDVVGSKIAASFDPGVPGRAVIKSGPGRLVPFQSAYVGGHTSDTPPPPTLIVQEFPFGPGATWEPLESAAAPQVAEPGPTDLKRLVATATTAFERSEIAVPRRPWLDELAPVYDLANIPDPSRDDGVLTFAIRDDPDNQSQYHVSFHPDVDGNMAAIGTGGSGKSAFLRTLAVIAGLGFRGGPCHVYGLDFGSRGLAILNALPHVGSIINGDDGERVERLLRMLRSTIDERAERYSSFRADSIADYRTKADAPDEARILVLLDNFGAFRSAYEVGPLLRQFDQLIGIAAEGRPVGVHLAVTADRPSTIPSSLNSVIQKQLILRLTSEQDLSSAGMPLDWFEGSPPPGRGYLDGDHVQVLVMGGSANIATQADAIDRLARGIGTRTGWEPAPAIERLAAEVDFAGLPDNIAGKPVIGISGLTLEPMAISTDDVFLVTGPPQSGRTSTLAALTTAIGRADPGGERLYIGPGRSFLKDRHSWSQVIVGELEIASKVPDLTRRVKQGWKPAVIVVEDHNSLLNSAGDQPLVDLLAACRAEGVLVVADSETGNTGSWPLQAAVKAGRHGIILQPDQHDGEQIYRTPLPRVRRSDFPPGRGFYIHSGVAELVQVANPVT